MQNGKFQIGLFCKDEVIFIFAKFGTIPWMDAPYSVHLSQPFEFENIPEGKGFGLTTLLADAGTGILKAIRYSGLPTEFSRKLRDAIEKQKNISWDERAYNKKLHVIYGNYSTDDLVCHVDTIYKIKE